MVEFGVCDTEFAQLDWLHLELMGRCVGLGLPLGQRALVGTGVEVCEVC